MDEGDEIFNLHEVPDWLPADHMRELLVVEHVSEQEFGICEAFIEGIVDEGVARGVVFEFIDNVAFMEWDLEEVVGTKYAEDLLQSDCI